MKIAALLVLGALLQALTYLDTQYFGNNLSGLWTSAGLAVVFALKARNFLSLLKTISFIFAGVAISIPILYLVLSLLRNSDPLSLGFYLQSLKLGAIVGLLVLLPMILAAPVVYGARRLWVRLRR